MTFKGALQTKDFAITAHVNMAQSQDAESLLSQAEILRPAVDAVQLTDIATGQMQMSGLAAAALLINGDVDPILHMTCRDRNRIALQRDLIGAAAIGVTSVMVMRGKEIPNSKKLGIRNVFDTPAKEFMAYVQSLKNAESAALPPDFLLGAKAEIFDPDADWTPENLNVKCDAGANFIQLQLCFDMDVLRNYMARIVASKLPRRANFIMSLSPLPSADVARWMRENVKGALIPDWVIERMEQAQDSELEGINICAELLRQTAEIPGMSGANLLTLGNLEAIPAAIEASGLRRTSSENVAP